MGFLDWMRRRGGTESEQPSRSYSLRSDLPERVLKTETDVRIDNALVEMRVVVDEISKNPSKNWQSYREDFEKAVVGVRETFESNTPAPGGNRDDGHGIPRVKQPGDPFEKGDRIVADEPFLYGGKPKENPDTPGVVDSVYGSGDKKTVCYRRVGMPPGNTDVENVRHATEQDMKKYEKELGVLEERTPTRGREVNWER
jgi:hypothetical protein